MRIDQNTPKVQGGIKSKTERTMEKDGQVEIHWRKFTEISPTLS